MSMPGLSTAASYVAAWRRTGRPASRQRQIDLMLEVGHALDVYTRRPLLRHSLHLMRVPARAAGLSALQAFLESGFDTFRAMHGADEFLAQIAQRERALAAKLCSMRRIPANAARTTTVADAGHDRAASGPVDRRIRSSSS